MNKRHIAGPTCAPFEGWSRLSRSRPGLPVSVEAMYLNGVVRVALALWLADGLLPGVRLSPDLTTLEQVGTLLVVAMLFTIVDGPVRVVRRAVRLLIEPLPLTVAIVLVLNSLLVWLTAALASAAGLAFSIDGFVTAVLAWLIVGVCRGIVSGGG